MGKITTINPSLLQPGSLWQKTIRQTQYALDCGALQPIPTEAEFIEQAGIVFLVRTLANLTRKAEAQKTQAAQPKSDNPFLPYDRDLFVADLTETHVCLLNKYNVVDHHLLIITREFENQETLLNLNDFAALWIGLAEVDGLGFYNSGKLAGASQQHKHLQLVPFPLVPTGENLPVQAAVAEAAWQTGVGVSSVFSFQHGIVGLDWSALKSLEQAAQTLSEAYQQLLATLNLFDPKTQALAAYNLLVTREWMLVVPRRQEQFASIPVNSLGFAGTLFVRNQPQLEQLKAIRPLTLLQEVAIAHERESDDRGLSG